MRQSKRVFLSILLFALVMCLASFGTAWATTTSTITVGGTDYTLFTGFTATAGTTVVAAAFNYSNMVDGDLSSSWHLNGEATPYYIEFNSDAPIILKGYIFNTYDANNFKPTGWLLKAKANTTDEWTTLSSKSGSLASGQEFQYACDNSGNNAYKYFRFEVSNNNNNIWLTEIRLYGYESFTYTHLTTRAATCTETGIKQDCYQRSDGKYFTDETGATELQESDVIAPMIPHSGVHHEATDVNIEYWQCSMCGKYFTNEACTHEVTADEVSKGIFGTLTAGTNGESGYYTLESKTYTLTEDVNTAGYVYVPEGVTATIDLNGHTIDRGLTSAVKNGMVIWVAGNLTVTDSGTGGIIKGGMDNNSYDPVSCVKVYSDNGGAAFTLQGGTLIGNTSYRYNCAVMGGNNTSITVSGGKITGDIYGVHSWGNVTVSGGEISGNTTGIYSENNSISVLGNPVITNNTDANVICNASVLNITGKLTAGASISITPNGIPTDNAPVTVTSGYGTYNSEPVSTYLSLDNDGKIQTSPEYYMTIVMGWNEDRTEIAVGTAMRTVNFDLQGHGSAIEAVSLLSGYKLIEPTEPTAEGWSFGGWYTDAECTDGNAWDFASGVTSDMTLYALWRQGELYKFTLPDKMVIVSATNEPFGGRYPAGTVIKFKTVPDYVLDGDVKNGNETLTADGEGIYTITVGNADITITATVKKAVEPNKTLSGSENYTAQNGDVLTGATSGTVTIASGASITLSDVTITGGIICEGSATITLVGTNSVTCATNKAGIEVGGENTTLTIKGNGSLTATGSNQSAGIGLSRAWDPANNVIGGDIVIESGTITANGGSQWGAGIGTGVIYGNGSAKTVRIGNITIKGGTVKATGGSEADGIGTGYTYSPCTNAIGTVTIYNGIDKVDASSIKNFASVVYMHGETNVTASKTDYFTIGEDGNRRLIVQKPVIADIPDQTYTGSAITPEPKVTIGSLSLTKGTDYEYSYTDNTNVGTNAKVTVTFKGDYASLGSVEKTFTIIPAVFVQSGIENGNVTADKAGAVTGETVTLTMTPVEGYNIGTVSYNDGSEHTIEAVNGVYSFNMPAVSVTISVTFTPIEYTITYNGTEGATFTTDNPTKYTVETEIFTLTNPTKNGYTFTGWTGTDITGTAETVTIAKGSMGNRNYTAGFEKNLSHWGKTDNNTPDGTSENPYIISTVEGWNLLVNELNSGNSYSGNVFRLDDGLTVTKMLGTNGTGFAGTFEGNGKTLTFDYSGAGDYVAPFRYVNGGTIKDLTLDGTITASGQYVGGIIGQSGGETTIANCKFVGKLLTTSGTIGGGFVAENNGTLTISNSLYAPATIEEGETEPSAEGSATFVRDTEGHTSTITNSYYTRTLGTAQGLQGYTVTADEGITIALDDDSANGLTYDEMIYAGSGETLSLTISGGDTKESYTFKGYKTSTGTLTESGGEYSLTMSAENVTISAEFVENISYIDADGQNATTSDYTVLTSSMTNLTAGTYVLKESVTVSALTLEGDVNLILCDGATLSVTGNVSGANSLVIYGQTNGTGTLTATNITLTENKNLSVYGGTLTTTGAITVAGTVTVKRATVNNETYDANGDSTTNYTVTFDSNGGSAVASQTLKFKYGETVKATEPAEPTRDNYGFVTWLLNDKTYDFATVVSRDITLTADWAAIVYDIEYLGVDGATNNNPTSYTVEDEITLNEPTKNGSTFAGWTGTGLSGATKSVTITKGSTGKRTYTATWTGGGSGDDQDAPSFKTYQLKLEGRIEVIFYVDIPEKFRNSDTTVIFDVSGDKSYNNTREFDETFTNNSGYYGFKCEITSVQMADVITATLNYKDNSETKTVTLKCRAKDYLDYGIAHETDATTLALLKAIKDYGHYVQLPIATENGWVVGKEHAEMDCDTDVTTFDSYISSAQTDVSTNYKAEIGSNTAGITTTYRLSLKTDTEIDVYVSPASSVSATYLDGSVMNVIENDRYRINIANISANLLGNPYTITVKYGNNQQFDIKVSALSYVNTVLTLSNSIDEKRAVTSLYRYFKATQAYMEVHKN